MNARNDLESEPKAWVVDGFNVLRVGGLVRADDDASSWWNAEARQKLLDEIAPFASVETPVTVVFDGARPLESTRAATEPRVVFAPSADEWIARWVRGTENPGAVGVVTADRRLSGRCRHRGARIVSPRAFLSLCRGVDLGISTLQEPLAGEPGEEILDR